MSETATVSTCLPATTRGLPVTKGTGPGGPSGAALDSSAVDSKPDIDASNTSRTRQHPRYPRHKPPARPYFDPVPDALQRRRPRPSSSAVWLTGEDGRITNRRQQRIVDIERSQSRTFGVSGRFSLAAVPGAPIWVASADLRPFLTVVEALLGSPIDIVGRAGGGTVCPTTSFGADSRVPCGAGWYPAGRLR